MRTSAFTSTTAWTGRHRPRHPQHPVRRKCQGGSTITQQLVKNVTGDNQNTVKRKVTEIYRALDLEKRYEKDEILEAYLNEGTSAAAATAW